MVLKAEKRIRLNCAENRWGQLEAMKMKSVSGSHEDEIILERESPNLREK